MRFPTTSGTSPVCRGALSWLRVLLRADLGGLRPAHSPPGLLPGGCFGGHTGSAPSTGGVPAAVPLLPHPGRARGDPGRRRLLLCLTVTPGIPARSPSSAFAAAAPSPPFCRGQIRRHRGVSGPGAAAAPVPPISMRPASRPPAGPGTPAWPHGPPTGPTDLQAVPIDLQAVLTDLQAVPINPLVVSICPRVWGLGSPQTLPGEISLRSLWISERTGAALNAKASLDTEGASRSAEGTQPLCEKVGPHQGGVG